MPDAAPHSESDPENGARLRQDLLSLFLTLVIGAVVGLVVVAFIVLTEKTGARLYPRGGAAWRGVLAPVLGSLVMGWLLYRYFPDARGSGVPQTKAALFAREGRITLGTVVGKFFCTSATLACGIPLGREGPSVQVGAGIASVLGRRMRLPAEKVKALLPVGAAAAITAAFNTPLAGVLFSLEEVMGDLHAPVLASAAMASATSWIVLRSILGDHPLFEVPAYALGSRLEFIVYAVLGLAGGVVSAAFTRLLLALRLAFRRMPRGTVPYQPVAGGILVALLGLAVPEVIGVGYAHVGEALTGSMALRLMAVLVVLKLLAVTVSYSSGNAGGIFGPSLFIGAMLGGAIGTLAQRVMPGHTASAGAYALVGMGAVFAGIVRAPMTSVVMIFELTRDYHIIVPLMIANLVSLFISSRLQKEPIYQALAKQDGIHLPKEEVRRGSSALKVADVMKPGGEPLPAGLTVVEALERMRGRESRFFIVAGEAGLIGVIARGALEEALSKGGGASRLAELLTIRVPPHVHGDHPLHVALERMGAAHVEVLLVLSRANERVQLGLVTLQDVLDAYGVGEGALRETPPAG